MISQLPIWSPTVLLASPPIVGIITSSARLVPWIDVLDASAVFCRQA